MTAALRVTVWEVTVSSTSVAFPSVRTLSRTVPHPHAAGLAPAPRARPRRLPPPHDDELVLDRVTLALARVAGWQHYIWMGVSVERAQPTIRIDHSRATRGYAKFLSLEPFLGPLTRLDLKDIDWVIVGGKSGLGARVVNPAWVQDSRDQCQSIQVPFFFKQWGGVNKNRFGRVLDGSTYDEMPLPTKKISTSLTVISL